MSDKKISKIIDADKVIHATEVVKNFLLLFPKNRVLSAVETAFVTEAIDTSIKGAFK